ncbi:MAG: efflux RND transporter periplasmic adaptor subunit [Methylophilaceae bacterium]|nr:efflux RND transporter periplasmic adaptor subunit [Methylophilaceae bacterium]
MSAYNAFAGQAIPMTAAQIKTLGITSTTISQQANASSQRIPGEIVVPIDQARVISAPQSGLIDQVMVAAGQQVKQGQALAHLSSPDLVALQRDHLQALSQHRLSENSFNRDTELYKDGIIAERRYLTSQSNHAEVSALLNERRQALKLSGMSPQAIKELETSGNYSNGLNLSSPIDGIVLEQMVTAGQRVDGATPIYRIAKLSPLWLEMHVPTQLLSGIQLGMSVRVANAETSGKVIAIVPSINKLDQTALVRVLLNKNTSSLAPGQLVEAEIAQASTNKQSFSIPKNAIVQINQGKNVNQSFVFVQTQNGFEARPVKVFNDAGTQAIISGQFNGNESIVTSGTATLKAKLQGVGGDE